MPIDVMYKDSWQNWIMYNATIPVYESGDSDGEGTNRKRNTMSLWDIGQRIMNGKGV